jgi:hypothetical protein
MPVQSKELVSLLSEDPSRCVHAAGCSLVAEVLAVSGAVSLRVTGRSMLPSVWPGDVLFVRRRSVEQVVRGDILLFRRQGRLFAHRVVSVVADELGRLVVRGDGLPAADAPVLREEVLGTASRIVRHRRQFEPRSHLRRHERLIASLFRHVPWMASVAVRILQLRGRLFPGGESEWPWESSSRLAGSPSV